MRSFPWVCLALLALIVGTVYLKEFRKPVLTPEQVVNQKKETNRRNGSGVTIWVDYKHNVVCYIVERQVLNGLGAGISCLPFSQVTNIPAE